MLFGRKIFPPLRLLPALIAAAGAGVFLTYPGLKTTRPLSPRKKQISERVLYAGVGFHRRVDYNRSQGDEK